MEITPTITNTTTTTTATIAKSPEAESEPPTPTPTRIQPSKPLSFGNGILKRHVTNHNHSNNNHHAVAAAAATAVTYRECLKNHAASLGGHALDGCGEFMPSPTATAADPSSLKCAACGCHRNFHRRDPDDPLPSAAAPATHVIEYQPHHRHHPPPPPRPASASPPPISSSFYPSAPHMLLALSGDHNSGHHHALTPPSSGGRKRFRTKFSSGQKEKMFRFAERVGWKMQKRDEELVREFCSDAGVDRGVLKVWMHNNKNTFAKKDGLNGADNGDGDGDGDAEHNPDHLHHVGTNGSSSSS